MSVSRRRLDSELVRRGLARSRQQAVDLIDTGDVRVNGTVATKAATQVDTAAPITVGTTATKYVSRGAHKLLGALQDFDIDVTGRMALDAGASTGGFTQVLLEAGVEHVIAVDVGYGQLAWQLQQDPRVTVMDRVNVRHLTAADLDYRPDLVVADLSFISLRTVLPALVGFADPVADFLLLVKPQFEVGKGEVGSGGVVRRPEQRAHAIEVVAQAAETLGLGVRDLARSALPGPSGNVEFVIWLTRGADPLATGRAQELAEGTP